MKIGRMRSGTREHRTWATKTMLNIRRLGNSMRNTMTSWLKNMVMKIMQIMNNLFYKAKSILILIGKKVKTSDSRDKK